MRAPTADDRKPAWQGALAGIVSAGLALGVAELIAGFGRGLRSPVVAIGDRVVDLAPKGVRTFAIDTFGTNDKPALIAGTLVGLALFAVVIGVLAVRVDRRIGPAGVATFTLLGVLAVLTGRADHGLGSAAPPVLAGVVAAVALWWLTGPRPSAEPAAAGADRRRFLLGLGAVGASAVVAAAAGRALTRRLGAAASRAAVVLPRALRPAPAVPAGADLGVTGVAPLFTPNRDFYRIDTALLVPQVPAESWTLRVKGMVDEPFELSYDDLLALPLVESDITMTCVSNEIGGGLVGTARWLGVRLDELLDRAGVDPSADQVVGRSVDNYTCGFPLEAAVDGRDAIVAVGMNGEPLPLAHGFPARLVVPGLYGYVSATKWLTEIELTTFDRFDQYWVPRGYAREAPIHTQSRIDTPRGLARIAPGPTAVAGVAWAQTRGIRRVEVSVDDGPWRAAELGDEVNDTTWRQWVLRWDATPGRHQIVVRATDGTGDIQAEERSEPFPSGATGWHKIVVLVDERAA